ncbi:Uncharacterized protein HZ326_28547 [Fusarium oxysporum f. sp. albedinis]|nr:Uncharacterized protein HZ326_28547 [Fusarium oxysporum f. sp. albedinis]
MMQASPKKGSSIRGIHNILYESKRQAIPNKHQGSTLLSRQSHNIESGDVSLVKAVAWKLGFRNRDREKRRASSKLPAVLIGSPASFTLAISYHCYVCERMTRKVAAVDFGSATMIKP